MSSAPRRSGPAARGRSPARAGSAGAPPIGRALLLAVLLAVATFVPGRPADGHASRSVPHATLSSDGHDVHIEWTAAQDDTADVLVAAGLLPPEAMESFLEGPIEDRPGDDEVRELSRSAQLRAYLDEHVAVTQDGTPCPGRSRPADHFIDDGARFDFTCPEPVTQAHVRISLLHDRDPAYRTYSVDGTIQTEMHTSTDPEHLWDFTLAAGSQRDSTRLVLLAALGAVGLALAGAWRLLRPAPEP